jgi:hypothetical protein
MLPRMPQKKSVPTARNSASRIALSISAIPKAATSGGMPASAHAETCAAM